MPHAGSVIRWRTITLIRAPNTSTPRCRTLSVVSSAPRRREPETKSARLSRIGCTTRPSSSGSYWPSASIVAMIRDPRALRQPVAQPQRRALSPVDRHVADERAGLASLGRGGVLGAVDDDDHLGREACGFARDLGDHLGDGGLLVVGRDHDRERRAGAGRVRREELARGVALSGLERGDLGVDVERLGGCGHVLLALLAREAHFCAPTPGRPTAPEPANTASWSICDHSCHTPTSPSSKVNCGDQPAARALLLSTMTAGISPALAGP